MTINREPEASFESRVDDPQQIAFAWLKSHVVNVRNSGRIDVFVREAIDVAFAVENDARVFQSDLWVCCREGAVVALKSVQHAKDALSKLDLPQSVMISGNRG